MDKSLFRCKVGTQPFQHISVDPLGSIRVIMQGSHTGKLTPLIICDLNTGAVAKKSMQGCKVENVFLALQRLQFRFASQIVQAYTNKGAQLGKMLGNKSDYWSERLAGIMKIFNNLAMAQYRNICERKVKILKRLLKMGIMGNPGPQTSNVRLEVYLTVLEQAAHAINTTSYLAQGSYGLLTPAHFINPWITSQVMVRELPESNMLELRRTRYTFVNQIVKIYLVMKEG